MSILQFDCRFRYPGGFALQLNFELGSAVTALVGPSGCGKTAVLNLIAGLLRPESGRVVLQSRILFSSQQQIDLPPERRGIGYVFQDYQLFPHLTVEQNLRYGERRTEPGKIGFEQVIDVLKLKDVLQRRPVALSGGQKQRVALGRAILRSPQLLLLDEPLSAVDVAHRRSIEEFLSESIAQFHVPMLLVSHDEVSVERLADSVVRM
jgi:molybdate transport system ATP-binding protein